MCLICYTVVSLDEYTVASYAMKGLLIFDRSGCDRWSFFKLCLMCAGD